MDYGFPWSIKILAFLHVLLNFYYKMSNLEIIFTLGYKIILYLIININRFTCICWSVILL